MDSQWGPRSVIFLLDGPFINDVAYLTAMLAYDKVPFVYLPKGDKIVFLWPKISSPANKSAYFMMVGENGHFLTAYSRARKVNKLIFGRFLPFAIHSIENHRRKWPKIAYQTFGL